MTALPDLDGPAERSWLQDAACRDQPSAWFTDPADRNDLEQAMATCTECRVRKACLTTALSHPEYADIGVWGGTTEHTRRRIRTGALGVDEALNAPLRRRVAPPDAPRPEPATAPRKPTTKVARPPVPELTVGRTTGGSTSRPMAEP